MTHRRQHDPREERRPFWRRSLTPEERALREARRRANRKLGFLFHLLAYASVNVFLLLVAGFRPALVTALGWGIGLVFHYFTALVAPDLRRRLVEREVARQVEQSAPAERRTLEDRHARSLERLAAGVAHEIRNPIGMIKSSAQLLEGATGLSERDRALLGVIETEATRVAETITEFVGFAAPTKPSVVACEIAPLFERVRAMLGAEAERRGMTIAVDLPEGLPPVLADPELLHRALANLVLNALQVQTRGGWVGLSARSAGPGEVALHVADRGPGIPEGDLERIFQPFFSRRAGGTGLGLSIVQRIVSATGGRISVTSGKQGSAFSIVFPEAET
jgi:signal transduction histidine kinase